MALLTPYLADHEIEESPPGDDKVSRTLLRHVFYLLGRVQDDMAGMGPGWTANDTRPGPHNVGAASVTWLQEFGFYVVSASGTSITVALPGGGDPRNVVVYQVSTPRDGGGNSLVSYWGWAAQPGDRISFGWPSSLYYKAYPTVLAVSAYDAEAQTLTLTLDQDVSAATTSLAVDNAAPEHYVMRTWRHCGSPRLWPVIADPPAKRCRHCVRDCSASVQNAMPDGYATESVDGGGSRVWYCAKRHWSTGEVDQETGDVTYTHNAASGLADFVVACNQEDCTGYERLPVDEAGGAFSVRRDWARWLRHCHAYADSIYSTVYAPGQDATWTPITRMGHPSAMWLLGGLSVESLPHAIGYEAAAGIPKLHGYACIGDLLAAEADINDNIFMRIRTGYDWDASTPTADLLAVEYDDEATWPDPGHAARLVTGWTSIRQQLAKGTAQTDATDPTRQMRQGSPFSAVGLARDTVGPAGRGFQWDIRANAASSVALVYERIEATVIGGVTYVARLVCPLLTAPGKGSTVIASRTVAGSGAHAAGQVWVDLTHTTHAADWQDNGVTPPQIRNVTWRAGGGAGFPVASFYRQLSANEPDTTMGGALAVMPGDGCVVNGRVFAVLEVIPCGGVSDTDWQITGSNVPGLTTPPSYAFAGSPEDYATWAGRRDRVVLADESGLADLTAGSLCSFVAGVGAWIPPATAEWSADHGQTWTALTEGALYEHGRGYVWLTAEAAALASAWRLV